MNLLIAKMRNAQEGKANMSRRFLVAFCFGLWTLIAASWVQANGSFQSVTGDVKAVLGAGAPANVAKGQRILPGTAVTTGPGGQAIIRLDDGQAIVLHENTEFRLNEFVFDKDKPQGDNIVMQLVKGAMRLVSGLIGSRSENRFALQTVNATIGIRGTDFMIAQVNPTYLSVLQGTIGAVNTAGSVAFGAGATATVASPTVLAVAIPAAALPAAVATTFSQLSSVAIAAGAAGGAQEAAAAAVGGLTPAGIIAAAAVVGAVAAAVSSSDNPSAPGITGTTGTTGTK